MLNHKAFLTVMLTCVAFAVAGALTWLQPVWVSQPDPQFGDFRVPMNNAWGAQSFDYEGEVVHVIYSYTHDVNDYTEIRYARSNNGGASFPNRVTLSDFEDEDNACWPALAMFGLQGNFHDLDAIYYDEDWHGGSNGEERYCIVDRRSNDQGQSWLSEGHVSDGSDDDDCAHPSVTTGHRTGQPPDEYYLHATWTDEQESPMMQVWYARESHRVTDADSAPVDYSRQQLTNSTTTDARNPSVAAYENNVYVVWYDDHTGDDEVWMRRSNNSGSDWLPAENVSQSPGLESQAPCVVACQNNVIVAWQEENPGDHRFRIRYRRSFDFGLHWKDTQTINLGEAQSPDHNTAPECFAPSIAVYNNQYLYFVFQAGWDTPTPSYGIIFMMSNDLGTTLLPPEGIGGWTDEEPDLDVGDAGLFPTVTVSKGGSPNPYLNMVYSSKMAGHNEYQVFYRRANWITTVGSDGAQTGAGALACAPRLTAAPNPAAGDVRIALMLARGAQTNLAVYDVEGRMVRNLTNGLLGGGTHVLTWNRRDDNGAMLPVGAYVVVLRTPDGTASRQVHLISK